VGATPRIVPQKETAPRSTWKRKLEVVFRGFVFLFIIGEYEASFIFLLQLERGVRVQRCGKSAPAAR